MRFDHIKLEPLPPLYRPCAGHLATYSRIVPCKLGGFQEDGYISFSPAEQFEKGNTLDEPFGENVVIADLRSFKQEEIDNWFTYHAPTKTQVIQYGELRTAAKIFAETINKHVPAGADKTAAMRELRGCVMAANLAIACYQKPVRPTIEDLEKILNSKDDTPVTINPDGSVTVDTL